MLVNTRIKQELTDNRVVRLPELQIPRKIFTQKLAKVTMNIKVSQVAKTSLVWKMQGKGTSDLKCPQLIIKTS